MALKLLFRTYSKFLHIALLLLAFMPIAPAVAQSVLLPGDIAVVSVSADSQWVDFIPLLDIEKGTEFYIGEGRWDDSAHVFTGREITLRANETLEAGTHIHVDGSTDNRVSISGSLALEGETHRLFFYQKEAQKYRFITAVAWGKEQPWNNEEQKRGSDLPESLRLQEHSVLSLGPLQNYQYYLRNGASGTPRLIRQFVYDAANWRTSLQQPFSKFGTSFSILKPPVILFDSSVSAITESDTTAVLNVAIYEHDGSRLVVDVLFDTMRSTASLDDFDELDTVQTINFTGLIGDAVYEVSLPLKDDAIYEARENAIFELSGLTKGNFGDFLTHSLIINDNEIPQVEIIEIQQVAEGEAITLKNREDAPVSLQGWSFLTGRNEFTFHDDVEIAPGKTLTWYAQDQPQTEEKEDGRYYVAGLNTPFLKAGSAVLVLQNSRNEQVAQLGYQMKREGQPDVQNNPGLANQNRASGIVENEISSIAQAGTLAHSSAKQVRGGWQIFADIEQVHSQFPEKELYSWNPQNLEFEKVQFSSNLNYEGKAAFGLLEAEEQETLATFRSKEFNDNAELRTYLAAVDQNENGIIDGIEGLNLVYNNSNQTFRFQDFLNAWQRSYPDIDLGEDGYGIKKNARGERVYRRLESSTVIEPGAAFWVQLNQPVDAGIYAITPETQQQVLEEEEAKAKQAITFTLHTNSASEEITIGVFEEENPGWERNLNMYEQLLLDGHQQIGMGIEKGSEYYRFAAISSELKTEITHPVWIKTGPEAGRITLDVSEWDDIPKNWNLSLTDQFTEKQYEVNENFSLTFDAESHETMKEGTVTDKHHGIRQRFLLTITPKEARSEVAEDEAPAVPKQVELHQNYPNPFNPATAISFYLPESQWVRLSVFNIVGQPVAVITEGTLSAGEHQVEWNAADKPSGMYIYQLEVGNKVMTRKMTLVK